MEHKAYDTICHNRHILIDNGVGRLLIDTGSPASFHNNGEIDLAGEVFPVPADYMGVNAAYLTDKVGCEIVGLIGMDILSRLQVWFNTERFGNFISFGPATDCFPSWPHIETFHAIGIPGITVFVEGRATRLLFDTGAPISYIKESYLYDCIPSGSAWDFSPLTGGARYKVDLYSANAIFHDKRFDVSFAKLTPELDMMMSMIGADGIIGYDLIESFRIILNGGEVWLPPQGI